MLSRKRANCLDRLVNKIKKKEQENPIINQFEERPEIVTKHENTKELQEILVQTCIDYINKHNLTDIDSVRLYVDGLIESAKEGKWLSSSDSYFGLFGIGHICLERKDGVVDKVPITYPIDEIF